MRVLLAAFVLFASADAFAPSSFGKCTPSLRMSTVVESSIDVSTFKSRLEDQLSKMKERDSNSKSLVKGTDVFHLSRYGPKFTLLFRVGIQAISHDNSWFRTEQP